MSTANLGQEIVNALRRQRDSNADQTAELAAQVEVLRSVNADQAARIKDMEAEATERESEISRQARLVAELAKRIADAAPKVESGSTSTDSVAK